MATAQIITSVQNPKVKEMVRLKEKSKARVQSGTFIIEGLRELKLALQAGYSLLALYYQDQICARTQVQELISLHLEKQGTPLLPIQISPAVFEKIAQRQTTEGIIAVVKSKTHHLKELVFKNKTPLILVAEAPEKPGNIGALLRTADAAGVDAVIIANPKTDLYNTNIIRSSVGGIFTVPIAMGPSDKVLAFLQHTKANIYTAALQASKPHTKVSYIGATAIVVGTEATGLDSLWLKAATQNICIPMRGVIDSMNVSVAAGILIFEAVRQRGYVQN